MLKSQLLETVAQQLIATMHDELVAIEWVLQKQGQGQQPLPVSQLSDFGTSGVPIHPPAISLW